MEAPEAVYHLNNLLLIYKFWAALVFGSGSFSRSFRYAYWLCCCKELR